MAERKLKAVEPEPEPEPEQVPDQLPYNLEPLTPGTTEVLELWAKTTQNRISELTLLESTEWARFLTDLLDTVIGCIIGEQ